MEINKKGLIDGVFILIFILFSLGMVSLLTLKMFAYAEPVFLNMTIVANDTVMTENIERAFSTSDWFDNIFVFVMVALYISYLISAVSLRTDEPVYFLVFVFLLALVTIVAMIISNAWVYMFSLDIFSDVVGLLTMTDFVMRFLPFISLVVGIIGAVLFYSRKQSFSRGGGNDGVNLLE